MNLVGPKVLMLFAAVFIAGCDTTPTPAEKIRALPAVSVDQALKTFRQVCVNNGQNDLGNSVIFSRSTLDNGQPLCSMRARLPEGLNAPAELRKRFGNSKPLGIGVISQFPGYPGKPLLLITGISNGADAGTYQIGITG